MDSCIILPTSAGSIVGFAGMLGVTALLATIAVFVDVLFGNTRPRLNEWMNIIGGGAIAITIPLVILIALLGLYRVFVGIF